MISYIAIYLMDTFAIVMLKRGKDEIENKNKKRGNFILVIG